MNDTLMNENRRGKSLKKSKTWPGGEYRKSNEQGTMSNEQREE
jgi:hypothetical protein